MKRALFGLFASFFACFSGAQMLPDSVEYFGQNGPGYQTIPIKTVIYTYDPFGQVIEEKIFHLRELGERLTYSYVNGRLVEKQLDWYNQDGNFQWTPQSKWTTFYSAAGLDTGFIEYVFNKSINDWEIRMSFLYALKMDSQNRIVDQLAFRVNKSLNSLDTIYRHEYFYQDPDNLPDSMTYTNWDDGAWGHSQLSSQVKWEHGFDYRIFEFNPTSQKVYTYYDGVWELSGQDSSVFVDGKMLEKYFFTKNMYNSLALYSSSQFDYDGVGNRISAKEFFYEYSIDPNGIKIPGNSEETAYTYNGATNDIREEIRIKRSSNGWESRTKVLYHYPSGTTAVHHFTTSNRVFPNPLSSSSRLFIENAEEVKELYLYSPEGKWIKSWTRVDQQGVRLDNIAAGVYFFRIIDKAGNSSTQRLIIK